MMINTRCVWYFGICWRAWWKQFKTLNCCFHYVRVIFAFCEQTELLSWCFPIFSLKTFANLPAFTIHILVLNVYTECFLSLSLSLCLSLSLLLFILFSLYCRLYQSVVVVQKKFCCFRPRVQIFPVFCLSIHQYAKKKTASMIKWLKKVQTNILNRRKVFLGMKEESVKKWTTFVAILFLPGFSSAPIAIYCYCCYCLQFDCSIMFFITSIRMKRELISISFAFNTFSLSTFYSTALSFFSFDQWKFPFPCCAAGDCLCVWLTLCVFFYLRRINLMLFSNNP